VILSFVLVDSFLGDFVLITDGYIYAVYYFFFRRGLAFKDIKEVYYHPTWIIGTRARTLSIVGFPNGKRKVVKLATNHFYSLASMAAIIGEIKRHNPHAELDDGARELIDKFNVA
jgi:hypothetical protein